MRSQPGCASDLRTRIIAAIAKADQDWCSDDPLHEDMADAVIRELDLGIPCANDGCRMRQIARRSAEKLGLTGDGA